MKEKPTRENERLVFEQVGYALNRVFGEDGDWEREDTFLHYFKLPLLYDDLLFVELIIEIEDRFGICLNKGLSNLFGYQSDCDDWRCHVERVTVGWLVSIIIEHLERVQADPATLLGKHCDTAAAFRAVAGVVAELDPKGGRLRPRTPIRGRLRGPALDLLWTRLSWIAGRTVPPLRETRLTKLGKISAPCTAFGIPVFLVLTPTIRTLPDRWAFLMYVLAFALLAAALLAIPLRVVSRRLDNRLPPGVQTFGDLARAMTADR